MSVAFCVFVSVVSYLACEYLAAALFTECLSRGENCKGLAAVAGAKVLADGIESADSEPVAVCY